MKVSIGNDHAGTDYKFTILKVLKTKGIDVKNYGTDSQDSVDYPDFVHPVAKDVADGKVDYGILICGSANGVSMTANKYQKVRAGLCWTKEIGSNDRRFLVATASCKPRRIMFATISSGPLCSCGT